MNLTNIIFVIEILNVLMHRLAVQKCNQLTITITLTG